MQWHRLHREVWSHGSQRCSGTLGVWHLGTCENGGCGLTVGLGDLGGLFQPSWFYDSMISILWDLLVNIRRVPWKYSIKDEVQRVTDCNMTKCNKTWFGTAGPTRIAQDFWKTQGINWAVALQCTVFTPLVHCIGMDVHAHFLLIQLFPARHIENLKLLLSSRVMILCFTGLA